MSKEKVVMMPFTNCPVFGDDLVEKEVEKLWRGGIHTAVVRVPAEVCLHCGECLYAQETVRYFILACSHQAAKEWRI